eukprot:s503_g5.t1
MDSLDRAQVALMKLRNRRVTHYIDLPRSNKRNREEIDTEDEAEKFLSISERVTSVRRGGPEPKTLVIRDEWNGPDAERVLHYRTIEPMEEPPGQHLTRHRNLYQGHQLLPPSVQQPGSFAEQRQRHAQQEIFVLPRSYGPARPNLPRTPPCSKRPLNDDDAQMSMDIDFNNKSQLPRGWKIEDFFITLDDNVQDTWELNGNYLTRRHFASRQKDFVPNEKTCPIPMHFLDKKKVVNVGSYLYREKWKSGGLKKKYANNMWTGYTRFKILPAW